MSFKELVLEYRNNIKGGKDIFKQTDEYFLKDYFKNNKRFMTQPISIIPGKIYYFNYLTDCDNRYKQQHNTLDSGQLIREMCDVIGIEPKVVKMNDINSGGAQYIFKNQDFHYWYKIYKDSTCLYDKLMRFQRKYPISPGEIQFWTAEMWSLLWNLWLYGFETKVTKELDFSWATDSIDVYEKRPILHMAGVTEDLKTTLFYKGDYINVNPLDVLKNDINFFNYVDKTSTGFKYINEMKKIIQK